MSEIIETVQYGDSRFCWSRWADLKGVHMEPDGR